MDEDENPWFDFHLETEKYYEEDSFDDEDNEEEDWKAKIVWSNYHKCTISSTEWDTGGFRLDTQNKKFSFSTLANQTFLIDTLPLKRNFDYEDLAFKIYLLGHDSCAGHEISFTKQNNLAFHILWKGKIALTYSGEEEFNYEFIALIDSAEFDGFYLPKGVTKEKAINIFSEKMDSLENFELVELTVERKYKLRLKP